MSMALSRRPVIRFPSSQEIAYIKTFGACVHG
jgi:hypothetical protein